jgi:5'-phosphate synthase pdxT subunit
MTTVGIVSLQGDFAEHADMLRQCGVDAVYIRFASQLDTVDGLIIPGGESTTIARLTESNPDPIFGAICHRARDGMPIYGTCMGAIFLARQIEGSAQGRLSLMDITVRRNAFGPQKFSREQLLDIGALGPQPFPAVFIRAPIILSCGPGVAVLSRIEEGIVMARQGNLLATSFHPEIANDKRVHEYFVNMVAQAKRGTGASMAGSPLCGSVLEAGACGRR